MLSSYSWQETNMSTISLIYLYFLSCMILQSRKRIWGWNVCEEEQKDEDGKKGIHRETEAKLLNAKHTQRKSLVLVLWSTETDSNHHTQQAYKVTHSHLSGLLPDTFPIIHNDFPVYFWGNIPCTYSVSTYSLCSNKLDILLQGWGAGWVRCFLWGDICSEDDNGYIVLTAWLVSLLGDSSAFLKTLPLWLGALFLSQRSSKKKKPLERQCTVSQIPQSHIDPERDMKDLLEIKVRQ